MKYVSLFAGIGGFDLALNRLGHECVYVNEWDQYAANTYEKNFDRRPDTRDIKSVKATEVPDHDLLVGGFPCQSFSIAGKRRGFDDTRGTLFFEVARILADKRPRYFILENVKGLLSHDGGKTFSTILRVLAELGYDYQWQILNSKNFGVPQNRERVFIVGNIRGISRPKVFPIRNTNSKTLKQIIGGSQGYRVYDPDGVSSTLASQAGGIGAKTGLYVARVSRREKVYNLRTTETSGALTATMYKGIDASGRTGVLDGAKIRRLTPVECERLQGFPDGWTEGVSDTQRYKQLGNAVTVNVVQAIAQCLN